MSKIFISYKRSDLAIVSSIKDEIKQVTGIDPWLDLDGIECGEVFEHKIMKAIRECDIVLFMMSKNSIAPYIDPDTGKEAESVQSWTEKEVKVAQTLKKRIVPISLDGTKIQDADWTLMTLVGVDTIDYKNLEQKKKFFKNMSNWLGISIITPDTYQGQSAIDKESGTTDWWVRKLLSLGHGILLIGAVAFTAQFVIKLLTVFPFFRFLDNSWNYKFGIAVVCGSFVASWYGLYSILQGYRLGYWLLWGVLVMSNYCYATQDDYSMCHPIVYFAVTFFLVALLSFLLFVPKKDGNNLWSRLSSRIDIASTSSVSLYFWLMIAILLALVCYNLI